MLFIQPWHMNLRALTILLLVPSCGSASEQGRTSFIHDHELIFEENERYRLDSLFRAHERATGIEILLATSPDMNNAERALDFAVDYGTRMGVGKKDQDNGVVIAFSKARREVFIATDYGTERVLHDSICQRIIDTDMLPRFKEGQHFEGLWKGSLTMVEFLERPENVIPPR